MKRKKQFLYWALVVWNIGTLQAQVTIEAGRGFIIPHRPSMKHLIKKPIHHLQIGYRINANPTSAMMQAYRHPSFYLKALALEWGNPSQLGTGLGVVGGVQCYLSAQRVNSIFMGWGMGMATQSFQRLENYKNNAIGSFLNTVVQLQYHHVLWRNETNTLQALLDLTHFSNASYSTPNLGINSITLGAAYSFGTKSISAGTTALPEAPYSMVLEASAAGFLKENYPPDGEKFFAHTFSIAAGHRTGYKSSWLLRYDYFFDQSLAYKTNPSNTSLQKRHGLALEHQLHFSKVTLLLGMGAYVRAAYREDGPLYHRITLRYHFIENLFLNIGLKSHFAKADYAEIGLGIKLFR